MASGSGSTPGVLGRAEVIIGANLAAFDTAMDQLSSKAKAKINKAIDTIKAEMEAAKLELTVQAGNPVAVQQLTDYLAKLKAQMDGVKLSAVQQAAATTQVANATRQASTAAMGAGGGFKNMGYGLLMVSQAVEDAQYGFSAIVNNIPGIVMAFGASAGVAGAVSLAAVAVNMLIGKWDQLTAAMGTGKIRTQAEEMEELRKKTALTAGEAEKLNRFQNLQDKVKQLEGGKSEEARKSEEISNKAIADAGFSTVVRGIRGTAPEMIDSQFDAAEVKAKIDELKRTRDSFQRVADNRGVDSTTQASSRNRAAEIDKQIKEMSNGVDSELERARDETAKKIIASGTLPADWNADNLKKIRDSVRANPNAFGPNGVKLGVDLNKATKPEMDKQRDRDQRLKAVRDRRETADKQGEMDTNRENFSVSQGETAIEEAKKNLARTIEASPYATGKINAAEKVYEEAVEAQAKLLEETYKRRKKQIDEMADDGLLTDQERAARQREIDAQRTRDRVSITSGRDDVRESRRSDALRLGRGFEDQYRNEALRDIGLGRPVNQQALRGKVSGDLQKSGTGKEDADRMAEFIVKELADKVQGQVRTRSQTEGVSANQAAKEELAKSVDESRARAYHDGGFSDIGAIYQKLQSAAQGSDLYMQETAANTRATAEATQRVYDQLANARQAQPPPAVAQGPR